jgi:hypothetical protein
MATKKPHQSLGIWGSLTRLTAFVTFLSQLPPDLIEETRMLGLAFMALVGDVMALIGRWRARLPISFK